MFHYFCIRYNEIIACSIIGDKKNYYFSRRVAKTDTLMKTHTFYFVLFLLGMVDHNPYVLCCLFWFVWFCMGFVIRFLRVVSLFY